MRQLPIRPKLLLFYGGTIAAVLVLFRITTAYGEARLEAPPNVNGAYLSSIAPPGCPPDSRLLLTVQQSGVYLNGALQLEQANESPEAVHSASSERLPLTGRWHAGEIVLSGSTDALATCQTENSNSVQLKGTIAASNQLAATLQFADSVPAWNFVGDRQTQQKTDAH